MTIYTKEELQEKKMKELREIGKEYDVNDTDRDELIEEIMEAQTIKGAEEEDKILIEYSGQINITNCNPEFNYTFNGKPVAVNKKHAEYILKNKDFKEVN